MESKQAEDNARLALEADRAALQAAQGNYDLAKTYVDWCVIRSPINGVVLEKLVNPDELVMPQSFGGGRGPSTALLAVADLKDLQVEIDVNEADLSKISLNQKCRVSPEAYPGQNLRRIRRGNCARSRPRQRHPANQGADSEPGQIPDAAIERQSGFSGTATSATKPTCRCFFTGHEALNWFKNLPSKPVSEDYESTTPLPCS